MTLAAFDYAVGVMRDRFAEVLAGVTSAPEKLLAIVRVYERIPANPPVPGGCPMLNAAVEADDANPVLRQRAVAVMDEMRRVIKRAVRDGQQSGTINVRVAPDAVAVVLICALEGAVMMSKLYGNQGPMRTAVRHLEQYVASLCS